MRLKSLLVVAAFAVAEALAQGPTGLTPMSVSEAERYLISFGGPQSRLAAFMWTDKYVYQPGEPITLRYTMKTNNDLYPYVVVAYRQNNQTGQKYYLPGNTETVTDINGNTLAQGFQPVQLSNVTKAALGQGLLAPAELGMHTFVVELRDYTGTRALRSWYMKIGVVSSTQVLQGEITTDRTLTNDTQWNLTGLVAVKNGATLTIQPGTFIIGQPGSQPPSVLLITRDGRLVADGTRSRPIILTSSRPFGQRQRGDWGGLLVLGKAPINVGANSGGNQNAAGEFYIEGLNATPDGLYGGSDPNHDCGTMRYVRVEYSGSILSPNNETNSFTWAGCGKNTVAEHLNAIYGADDSFEWFGGTMEAKYLVGGLGADDFVDFQLGYVGKVQFGIFYQSPNSRGNRGLEGDNSEYNQGAEPFSNPTMFNLTFVGSGQVGFDEANAPGLFLRRGARGSFNNVLVTNFFSPGVDVSDANTQAQADAGNVRMNGVLLWGNTLGAQGANTVPGQVAAGFTASYAQGQRGTFEGKPAGQNFSAADPLLGLPLEYSDPDFRGRFGSPIFRAGYVSPPDDGFFDQSATFIGGIGDDDWTEEWTNFLQDADIAP
jgi:hypothetical protein